MATAGVYTVTQSHEPAMAAEIVRDSDESDTELLPGRNEDMPRLGDATANMGRLVSRVCIERARVDIIIDKTMSSRPSHSLTKPSRSILKRGNTLCAPEMERLGSHSSPSPGQAKRPKTISPEDEAQSLPRTYRSSQRSITFATPEQNQVIEPAPLYNATQEQHRDHISMIPQTNDTLASLPTPTISATSSSSLAQPEYEPRQQPILTPGVPPECCARSSKRPQSIQWDYHPPTDTDPMSSASFAHARRALTDLPRDGMSQTLSSLSEEQLSDANIRSRFSSTIASNTTTATTAAEEGKPFEPSNPTMSGGENDLTSSFLQFGGNVSSINVTPPDSTPTPGQQQQEQEQYDKPSCVETDESRRSSGSNPSLVLDSRDESSENGTRQATQESPSVQIFTHSPPTITVMSSTSNHGDTYKSGVLSLPNTETGDTSLCERVGYSPISENANDSRPPDENENLSPEKFEEQILNSSRSNPTSVHTEGEQDGITRESYEIKELNSEIQTKEVEGEKTENPLLRPQNHEETSTTEKYVSIDDAPQRDAVIPRPNHHETQHEAQAPASTALDTPVTGDQSSSTNIPLVKDTSNTTTTAPANATFPAQPEPPLAKQPRPGQKKKVKRGKTSSAAISRKRQITDLDDDVIWLDERPVAETPIHQDTQQTVKTEENHHNSKVAVATDGVSASGSLERHESAQGDAPDISGTTQNATDNSEAAPKQRSRKRIKTGESQKKKPETKKRRKSTSISATDDVFQESTVGENGTSAKDVFSEQLQQPHETAAEKDKENQDPSPLRPETQKNTECPPTTPEPQPISQAQCPPPTIADSTALDTHAPTNSAKSMTPPPPSQPAQPSTPPTTKGPDKHSPITVNKKVNYRVGLSRSAKIAPLLRTIRK